MSNEICCVDKCTSKVLAKGYCSRHYDQLRKIGKIKERTMHDSNEFIFHENYAEMLLYNNQGEEVARTLIDLDDVNKIKKYKWYLRKGEHGNDYVICSVLKERLHRFLLKVQKGFEIDHIDRNTLNNKKCNLRIVTPVQNSMNRRTRVDSGTGIKGVSYEKRTNKYVAYITVNKEKKFLGRYLEIKEASKARLEAEMKYFGEYSPLSN